MRLSDLVKNRSTDHRPSGGVQLPFPGLIMGPAAQGKWLTRSATMLIWSLAAASALYWVSRIAGPGPGVGGAAVAVPAAPGLAVAEAAPARQAAVAGVLGALPPAAAAAVPGVAQRFALLGVIASAAGQGAALISVDGQPARPLRVGAQIAPGYRLEAVGRREAVLANDAPVPAQTILWLPAPETAATARTGSPAVAALPVVAEPAAAAPPAAAQSDDAGPPPRADSRRRSPASLQRSAPPGA